MISRWSGKRSLVGSATMKCKRPLNSRCLSIHAWFIYDCVVVHTTFRIYFNDPVQLCNGTNAIIHDFSTEEYGFWDAYMKRMRVPYASV